MLTFDHVSLTRRHDDRDLHVLRDLTFKAEPATVFAILGPSGAGKSTILRLACRLEDPDDGRILLGDADTRALDVLALRRRIGFLFQAPVLFGESVEENLRFAADPNRDATPDLDSASFLKRVGLSSELLTRPPDALSVGQRQRVALARALVPKPEVLLLDEPTSALDPQAATGIRRLIAGLRDDLGLTIVMVTHTVAEARAVADRVLILRDGAVLEQGGPDLLDAPQRPETRAFLAGEEE
jgi:putative ABC transport system ATP-binding protein